MHLLFIQLKLHVSYWHFFKISNIWSVKWIKFFQVQFLQSHSILPLCLKTAMRYGDLINCSLTIHQMVIQTWRHNAMIQRCQFDRCARYEWLQILELGNSSLAYSLSIYLHIYGLKWCVDKLSRRSPLELSSWFRQSVWVIDRLRKRPIYAAFFARKIDNGDFLCKILSAVYLCVCLLVAGGVCDLDWLLRTLWFQSLNILNRLKCYLMTWFKRNILLLVVCHNSWNAVVRNLLLAHKLLKLFVLSERFRIVDYLRGHNIRSKQGVIDRRSVFSSISRDNRCLFLRNLLYRLLID